MAQAGSRERNKQEVSNITQSNLPRNPTPLAKLTPQRSTRAVNSQELFSRWGSVIVWRISHGRFYKIRFIRLHCVVTKASFHASVLRGVTLAITLELFTMSIFALLLLLGGLSFLLADSSASSNASSLPIVDLGYELHQATFNVSDV